MNTACKDEPNPRNFEEPCVDCWCGTCLLITDIDNPPEITKPTCIKFADHITKIPVQFYFENGNITGVCADNVDTIDVHAFFRNQQLTRLYFPNTDRKSVV
jgi:hypothetical protein